MRNLTVLVLALIVGAAHAQNPSIDIVVMFELGTSHNTPNKKHSHAILLETLTNEVLANSGISDRQFRFDPAVDSGALLNVPQSSDPVTALNWMLAQNANPQSPLRLHRDTQYGFGDTIVGADVVLLSTDHGYSDTQGSICGGAFGVPTFISTSNSESHAFVVLSTASSNNCDAFLATTTPHEIGHVLYAEHQVDTNGSLNLPKPYNHGLQKANGSRSVMHEDAVGAEPVFSGSIGWTDDTSKSDVKFLLEASSVWPTVAAYREPVGSPPGTVDCGKESQGCRDGYHDYLITWFEASADTYWVRFIDA